MRRTEFAVAFAYASVGCTGCRNGGDGDATLVFTDENNYTYEAAFDFGEVEIEANADATIAWGSLTTDIRGRPMDPAATEQLLFVEFRLTQQEVLDLILSNSIDQGDTSETWQWDNAGATSINLDGNFNIIGNYFDAETMTPEDPTTTWILTLANLPNGGYDILTSKFVVPKTTSTNHEITFTDGCTTIEVDADLSSPPLKTQEGIGPYTVDWSGLKKDVNGEEWDPQNITGDNLIVAHYDLDLAGVEAEFVRLDVAATEYYQLDVFGMFDTDLTEATDAAGNRFGGFTADGVWLVGITCKTCISPLPLAVAVVDVAPE